MIVEIINKTIDEIKQEESLGDHITLQEQELLTKCELDSLSYVFFWLKMDDTFNCFSDAYINKINYKSYTILQIKARILSKAFYLGLYKQHGSFK